MAFEVNVRDDVWRRVEVRASRDFGSPLTHAYSQCLFKRSVHGLLAPYCAGNYPLGVTATAKLQYGHVVCRVGRDVVEVLPPVKED